MAVRSLWCDVNWTPAQDFRLTLNTSRLYSPKYLVFGKAVRVRHYPVTVSTEN